MVPFHEPKVVAVGLNDLLGQIALAEDRVAGDEASFQDDVLEHPEGGLVLVGLVLATLSDRCLGQRQP